MCTLTASAIASQRPGQDLEDLQIDLVGLAGSAVGLGIGQAEQPAAAQRAQHVARELAAGLVVVGLAGELPGGELAGQLEQVVGLGAGQNPIHRHRRKLNER